MFGKVIKKIPIDALPSLDKQEVNAIKAVYQGVASEGQQKLAADCIIKKFLRIGALSFDSDPMVMAFREGQRSAALQILFIVNTPIEQIVTGLK